MTITREDKDGQAFLTIRGPLSIYEVTDIRNELIQCFDNCSTLFLDLDEVTECDTAGVQLLCSARITADRYGKKLGVKQASAAVIDAMVCAGLNPEKILNFTEEK